MMMKSLIAAIILTVAIPAMAGGESVNVPMSATVMKGSDVLMVTSINATDGMPTPIEVSKMQPFRAQAVRGKDGKVVITPGTIKTGIVASLTPKVQKDGKVEADVSFDVAELVAMKSITSSDGLTVDAPEMNHTNLKQTVELSPNSPVILNFGDYTVRVLAGEI